MKQERIDKVVVWYPDNECEGYQVSYIGGGWLPGIYDSVETAVKASEMIFVDESRFIEEIQKPINHFDKGNRLITVDNLYNKTV